MEIVFSAFFFVLIYLGEVPCNHEIMRDALSLIQRLPVMKTDVFREDFYNVCKGGGGGGEFPYKKVVST